MQTSNLAVTDVEELDAASETTPYSEWVQRAACAGKSWLFEAPESADDALRVCGRCPVRAACRAWALHNAVDGVAGGLTADDRMVWRAAHNVEEPKLSLEQFLPIEVAIDLTDEKGPASRSAATIAAVARWTEHGESGRQIAQRLGCTRRNVVRLRRLGRERPLAG